MKNIPFRLLTCLLLLFAAGSAAPIFAQAAASCFAPGTQTVSDSPNDALLMQHDIESVAVAEPFSSDGARKLVFTLKVRTLAALPAASWNVLFTGPDNVTRYVQMSTLLSGQQFTYGTLTNLLGVPIFNQAGSIQGNLANDGTISFYVDKGLVGNYADGQTIAVSSRTYVKALLDLVEVDGTPVSSYTLAGSGGCVPFKYAFFGANGDIPVANDYTRNKTDDFAVWRPDSGIWYSSDSVTSAFNSFQLGSGAFGDIPVSGNYDNDGKGDFAVYRPSTGIWLIHKTETGSTQTVGFGAAEDIPLAGDYDGDRVDDIAVFRPSTGTWHIFNLVNSSTRSVQFGVSEDLPLTGDFDGDRQTDIAVFRPSNGSWYVLQSASNSVRGIQYGVDSDTPVPADYDGDGKTDIAVWRPETGVWYVFKSSTGTSTGAQWGDSSDRVQPGDYNGNGRADFGVWRPASGIWYVCMN